jgi:dTDP-4-dehydrorhamnose 3,5-epimerase
LRQIPTPGGDVFHGMKATDPGFVEFGEAYFSRVDTGQVKGWKQHRLMTLNFVVPVGEIQVSVFDSDSRVGRAWRLGPDPAAYYKRLTIRPGLWVAFGGIGTTLNVLLNLASMVHDPKEATNLPLDTYGWRWLPEGVHEDAFSSP